MSNWGIGYRSGDEDWWFLHSVGGIRGGVVTRQADKVKLYDTEEEAKKVAAVLGPQYRVMGRDVINKMALERFFGGVNDRA